MVNKGVKIKLMINEETENRKSENDFKIPFISTFRKRTKSISIRKISIKFPACFSRTGIVFPRNIPIKADKTIKKGCSFDKIFITIL